MATASSTNRLPGAIAAPRNDPDWLARHEGFKAAAAKGACRLLLLGDSITDCWDKTDPALYRATFGAYDPLNFGIGGDKTQNVLWRVRNGELQGMAPKVVMLLIGTNNIGVDEGAETPESAVAGVEAILGEIRTRSPESQILLLSVLPREERPDHPKRDLVKRINGAIRGLGDGERVHYLDIGARFVKGDGTIGRDIMDDFLHLTPKGYRVWADAISAPLAELMTR